MSVTPPRGHGGHTDSPSILADLEAEIAPVTAMLARYVQGGDGDPSLRSAVTFMNNPA
jgi:hypothetical protein